MKKTVQDILVKPILTEKAVTAFSGDQYTFSKSPTANKIEIRKAVEEAFKVKVSGSGPPRSPATPGASGINGSRMPAVKRAYVTLREGDK